jgi:nucleotide-binding universal stress UspA family protein
MLKKILVALDGSPNAARTLPWVRQYAARERAQVLLLRVLIPEDLNRSVVGDEKRLAQDYFRGLERELNYHGVPCTTLVRQGNPARVIVRVAERERCDLILMSTRGGSPVKRWALGGVTEQVLRLSPIPVLVVRSRTLLPRQGHVRRVIVPVDGSRLADVAIPWGARLAKLLKAKVVLLHVYPAGAAGLRQRRQEGFGALNARMARTCRMLNGRGQRAAFNVQRGDAAERILAFADQNDLIVTTTHGFGGFKRWIFGSVAEKLIRDASIPVLVYKTPTQVISAESNARPA